MEHDTEAFAEASRDAHEVGEIIEPPDPEAVTEFPWWETMLPWWQTFLDFLASIVSSLAWPLVVLIILLRFRKHIVEALNSLKSVSFGGATATFDRKLTVVEDGAKDIEPSSPELVTENDPRTMALLRMAETSTTGAIIEAWKDVEDAARKLVEASGLQLSTIKGRPHFSLQRFIQKNNLLPKAEIETFRELRMMRNRVAHLSENEVSTNQARRYVLIADRLVDALKTMAQNS